MFTSAKGGGAAGVDSEPVGGVTEVVTVPETLEQPQLSLMNYASEAETFMGICPDCSSQLEFAECWKKSTPAAIPSAGDFRVTACPDWRG